MGTVDGQKSRSKRNSRNSVKDYFPKKPKAKASGKASSPASKMASGEGENTAADLASFRSEVMEAFQKLEKNMTDKISAMIQPLSAQLEGFKTSLEKVAETADSAFNMACAVQEDTQYFYKRDEWATDKIIALENQLKMGNVKIRGLPENSASPSDLKSLIASWLSKALGFSESDLCALEAAYRIGPLRRQKTSLPRDILVRFSSASVKSKLLQKARAINPLLLGDYNIQILQDLSSETLQRRKILKPIIEILNRENIRYRWVASYKLQVTVQDRSFVAGGLDSGLSMLRDLNLPVPTGLIEAASHVHSITSDTRWRRVPMNRPDRPVSPRS